MEIKTAEQYVVSELIETKEILAETKKTLSEWKEAFDTIYEKYKSLHGLIHKYLELHTAANNENYISFTDSVWENFDLEDYNSFLSFFPELLRSEGGENTNGC